MEKTQKNWDCNNRKSTFNLALWTGAWVISMALASFGPKFIWNENTAITILAILLNLGLGIAMILSNRKHLNTLDELQRKVQLEAMGISLGVGVIFGLSYSMLDTTDLINYHAEISHLVILISLAYLAGIIIGNLRYR